MINGTITLTCDKCGLESAETFNSGGTSSPADVPTRDALLNESGFTTLFIGKEYMICPNCRVGWDVRRAKLTNVFQVGALDFLKPN